MMNIKTMRIVERLWFNEHAKKQSEQMIHMEVKIGFHQFPCLVFFPAFDEHPPKSLRSMDTWKPWMVCDNPTFLWSLQPFWGPFSLSPSETLSGTVTTTTTTVTRTTTTTTSIFVAWPNLLVLFLSMWGSWEETPQVFLPVFFSEPSWFRWRWPTKRVKFS